MERYPVSSVEYWVRLSLYVLGGRNRVLLHEVRMFNLIFIVCFSTTVCF